MLLPTMQCERRAVDQRCIAEELLLEGEAGDGDDMNTACDVLGRSYGDA